MYMHFIMIISTGSGNRLAPNMCWTIIWTNDGIIYWCIYGSLGLDELTDKMHRIWRQSIPNRQSELGELLIKIGRKEVYWTFFKGFMNEKRCILIKKKSLTFVYYGLIDNNRALIEIVAWCRIDKPSLEAILTSFTDAYMRYKGAMSY